MSPKARRPLGKQVPFPPTMRPQPITLNLICELSPLFVSQDGKLEIFRPNFQISYFPLSLLQGACLLAIPDFLLRYKSATIALQPLQLQARANLFCSNDLGGKKQAWKGQIENFPS